MTRADDRLLDVERRVREGRLRLGRGGAERAREVGGVVDEPHPAPAAARGGLEQEREADLLPERGRRLERRRPVGARHERETGRGHGLLGTHLVAHRLDRLGGRPDEDEVVVLARPRELRVLGQEAPARVDGVAAGRDARGDERGDLEVALGGRRRPDVDGAVGELDVERVAVGRRVDSDGLEPFVATRPDDPDGDLAAVGDQHPPHAGTLSSHSRVPRARISAVRSTRWVASGRPRGESTLASPRTRPAGGRSGARARRGSARTRPPARSRRGFGGRAPPAPP